MELRFPWSKAKKKRSYTHKNIVEVAGIKIKADKNNVEKAQKILKRRLELEEAEIEKEMAKIQSEKAEYKPDIEEIIDEDDTGEDDSEALVLDFFKTIMSKGGDAEISPDMILK